MDPVERWHDPTFFETLLGHLTFLFLGVSAPIVGTTSLGNLQDIIGTLFYPAWYSTHKHIEKQIWTGAINVKLSDEDIKYLEEPYQPQNIVGYQ